MNILMKVLLCVFFLTGCVSCAKFDDGETLPADASPAGDTDTNATDTSTPENPAKVKLYPTEIGIIKVTGDTVEIL